MSANPRTAPVREIAPARLLSLIERQTGAADTGADVAADLADAVEAIHQIANLAGFSERPRAFVLALASAAHSQDSDCVELYDEELAELQNCSAKTVGRQRADYLRETRRLRTVDHVGVEEGGYNRARSRMEPSRYSLHLSGVVAAVVAEARSDPRWADLDRKAQRDLLKRSAARVYDDIPDARRQGRKRRRPRLASDVVETHRKSADTHLRKLRETAALLTLAGRQRLVDEPGELRAWWLVVRAEMDALCDVNSPHPVTPKDIGGEGEQFVRASADEDSGETDLNLVNEEGAEVEPSPEVAAAWERLESRLTPTTAIHTVEVPLRPPEAPPGELGNEPDEDTAMEAEAIRAEGCGEL